MRRADRLFRIVQILRNLRFATAEELARRLEISQRTVYRDLRDLMAAGVPVRGEAGVGYCFDRDATLPPISFTDEELEALALGARMAEAWSDKALGEAARSAMEKIESILPRPLQTAIESTALFAPAGPWTRQYAAGLEILRKAVSEQKKVSFQYTRADGTHSTRTIRPLGLYFWGAKWSLAAWCELREGYRSFRPDRMNELKVLGDRFETTNAISLSGFLEWHLKEENSDELPFVESLAHATENARVS